MIYKAVDKWNSSDAFKHAWPFKKEHKYVAKVKTGSGTRYFYSSKEYEQYLRGKGGEDPNKPIRMSSLKEDEKLWYGRTSVDKPSNSVVLRNKNGERTAGNARTYYNETGISSSPKKISTGLSVIAKTKNQTMYDKPFVDKNDKDPRWAINSSYKPEASAAEKSLQKAKNREAKINNAKKKKFSVRNFLSQFTRKGK